jgi:uncharacterized protein GlcG (DUF336 family)
MLPGLRLTDAMQLIEAAFVTATTLEVTCSVAVVDAGGTLVGFARQDGAMAGSVELAVNKAFTACMFANDTATLGTLSQPGAELYGIQHSHSLKVVVFGGGAPVRSTVKIVGALGVSGGSVRQDIEIMEAALLSYSKLARQ